MSSFAVETKTVAERLGYEPDAKLLIIHGDDIGMCHSANVAAKKAFDAGIMKSGSVMVPCPWFLEAAEYARNNPDADLGIHLTLTAEWKHYRWRPLSMMKGLMDAYGFMHHGIQGVYANATPKEIEAEVRAQIELALKMGMKPTHLDSHMGTLYYNPEYIPIALKLSEEYDIPLMFFKANDALLEKLPPESREAFVKLSNMLESRGVPLLDAILASDYGNPDRTIEIHKQLIKNLKPGVTEIYVHLASESEEYRAITGTYEDRLAEFRFFTDSATKEWIEAQGIHLIGWKDLLPLWKERKPLSNK